MYGILFDATKCSGCEKCVAACVNENNLNPAKAEYDRANSKDGLSDSRMLSLIEVGANKFARKGCMHCLEPSCVSACLVGGITKSPEGPVVYDPDKCIGCRYCMLSCPFHIPRYEWSDVNPRMVKCSMCYERVKGDCVPVCVANCPNGALTFGERNDLIRRAKDRIARGGGKYIDRVWGEKEFGGTSVLCISDVSLEKVGWPQPNTKPISELTDPLIEKTPIIGGTVAGSLIGLSWIIRRRDKLAAERKAKKEAKNEK